MTLLEVRLPLKVKLPTQAGISVTGGQNYRCWQCKLGEVAQMKIIFIQMLAIQNQMLHTNGKFIWTYRIQRINYARMLDIEWKVAFNSTSIWETIGIFTSINATTETYLVMELHDLVHRYSTGWRTAFLCWYGPTMASSFRRQTRHTVVNVSEIAKISQRREGQSSRNTAAQTSLLGDRDTVSRREQMPMPTLWLKTALT